MLPGYRPRSHVPQVGQVLRKDPCKVCPPWLEDGCRRPIRSRAVSGYIGGTTALLVPCSCTTWAVKPWASCGYRLDGRFGDQGIGETTGDGFGAREDLLAAQ